MHKRIYQAVLDQLARSIKKRRAELGISQEDLAFQSGIDRTFVSKIERSIANPSLKTILDIAEALDISLSDLFKTVERES